MNALAVGTPASTIAGSSAIGSSIPPADRQAQREVDRGVVRRDPPQLAIPARIDRCAAGDEPVPGLLNARNVVVPPNAAATESWKNRSGSSSDRDPGVGVDVDRARQDEQPGRVDDLAAAAAGAREVGLDRLDDAARTATSAGATRPP